MLKDFLVVSNNRLCDAYLASIVVKVEIFAGHVAGSLLLNER